MKCKFTELSNSALWLESPFAFHITILIHSKTKTFCNKVSQESTSTFFYAANSVNQTKTNDENQYFNTNKDGVDDTFIDDNSLLDNNSPTNINIYCRSYYYWWHKFSPHLKFTKIFVN